MKSTPTTICVHSGLELIGDGVMKLPFIRGLRAAYPDARITWVAGRGRSVYADVLAPLVEGLIDEVIEQAGIEPCLRVLLSRPLDGRRFDLVIDTQSRARTALVVRRIRHGRYVGPSLDWLLSDSRPPKGASEKSDSLADKLDSLLMAATGLAELPPRAPLVLDPACLKASEAAVPELAIGLVPGAGGPHKCWPLDRFEALARALVEQDKRVAFILGPNEADWQERLAEAVPGALFPLQDKAVAEDIRKSPLFTMACGTRLVRAVAGDCGAAHILAAVDTPLLSLFGPTRPTKFAPATSDLIVLRAQDFGGQEMESIPLNAILAIFAATAS